MNRIKRGIIILAIIFLAMLLEGGLVAVFSLFRGTVKEEKGFDDKVDAKLLGTISHEKPHLSRKERFRRKKRALLINDAYASLKFSEEYQKICNKFEYMYKNQGKQTFVISSVAENEGKSTVASNISLALAELGYNVILLDMDLHKPSIYKIFDFYDAAETDWSDILSSKTELVNTNKLVRFYPGTTGLKTGTTSKAGCCLSATAERDGLHLVAVVMGSENSTDRFETAKALLDWGFSNYESINPAIDRSLITDVLVMKGEKDKVSPAIPETEPILVKKGRKGDIKQTVTLSVAVNAPVEKGQTLGNVEFTLDGEKLAVYNLLSPENVDTLKLPLALRRLLMRLI